MYMESTFKFKMQLIFIIFKNVDTEVTEKHQMHESKTQHYPLNWKIIAAIKIRERKTIIFPWLNKYTWSLKR